MRPGVSCCSAGACPPAPGHQAARRWPTGSVTPVHRDTITCYTTPEDRRMRTDHFLTETIIALRDHANGDHGASSPLVPWGDRCANDAWDASAASPPTATRPLPASVGTIQPTGATLLRSRCIAPRRRDRRRKADVPLVQGVQLTLAVPPVWSGACAVSTATGGNTQLDTTNSLRQRNG